MSTVGDLIASVVRRVNFSEGFKPGRALSFIQFEREFPMDWKGLGMFLFLCNYTVGFLLGVLPPTPRDADTGYQSVGSKPGGVVGEVVARPKNENGGVFAVFAGWSGTDGRRVPCATC
jgi:hypothetical protein